MRNKFVFVKYPDLPWVDKVIFMPVGTTFCAFIPLIAIISGENTFWGLSLTNCVLIGIGFLVLAVIERLALLCRELLTMTFLVKTLFNDQNGKDLIVSQHDWRCMCCAVRRALGIGDNDI
jgi:hypothetical protein